MDGKVIDFTGEEREVLLDFINNVIAVASAYPDDHYLEVLEDIKHKVEDDSN